VQSLSTYLRAEVERDAQLVPIDGREPIVLATDLASDLLDFDYFRTQVGEELGAERAGQKAAAIEDSDTGERSCRVGAHASHFSERDDAEAAQCIARALLPVAFVGGFDVRIDSPAIKSAHTIISNEAVLRGRGARIRRFIP
jgi:hypothetical protein